MKMDSCICCGKYVPEGRQICAMCEADVVRAQKEYERNSVDCSVNTILEVEAILKSIGREISSNECKD